MLPNPLRMSTFGAPVRLLGPSIFRLVFAFAIAVSNSTASASSLSDLDTGLLRPERAMYDGRTSVYAALNNDNKEKHFEKEHLTSLEDKQGGKVVLASNIHASVPQESSSDKTNETAEKTRTPRAKANPSAVNKSFSIALPVRFDDFFLGEVAAEVGLDNSIQVDVSRLADLLEGSVTKRVTRALRSLDNGSGSGELISPETFGIDGLNVEYDPGLVTIVVSVDTSVRGQKTIGERRFVANRSGVVKPSDVAVGVSLFGRVAQSSNLDSSGQKEQEFEPVIASALGFANLWGDDGIFVTGEAFFDEGRRTRKLRRGNVTVFKDFENAAIRASAGDILPLTTGFGSAPRLGGVAVARLYNEIQPFRNIRATGQLQFVLEQSSTIEVEINGVITQTLRLDPGSYDLRNLGLSDGLNEVVLIVNDASGRREILRRSLFFTGELLDPGISTFSASFGFPRQESSDGISYGTEDPTFSGFFRYGLNSDLTLGVEIEANRSVQLFGGNATVSTPFGVVTSQLAGTLSDQADPGFATTVQYSTFPSDNGKGENFNLSFGYTSPTFAGLTNPLGRNTVAWSLDARYGRLLIYDINFQIGAGYLANRFGRSDEQRYQARFSIPVGSFDLALSLDRRSGGDVGTINRALLALTMPIGQRQRVRLQGTTENNGFSADWSRTTGRQYDDWTANVLINRTDELFSASGQYEYRHNRFEARIRTDIETDPNISQIQRRRTSLDAAVGLAFAGGKFAIGRPVEQGFAIVSTHESLDDRSVIVGSIAEDDPGFARNGLLGPALVPFDRPYIRRAFPIDVENLPSGYDIGGGEFAVVPAARSGFAIQVGSAASNTVLGSLQQPNGEPFALIGGMLRPLKPGKDREESTFFTNRSGRFVAERVAPGDYEIVYGKVIIGTISVPDDSTGLVQVGVITQQKEQ
ncbi:MAG: hypothetical protein AAF668_02655 [Pseudomonadota bacterium]